MDALVPVITEKFAERLADRIADRFERRRLPGLMHADYRHHLVLEVLRENFTITDTE